MLTQFLELLFSNSLLVAAIEGALIAFSLFSLNKCQSIGFKTLWSFMFLCSAITVATKVIPTDWFLI